MRWVSIPRPRVEGDWEIADQLKEHIGFQSALAWRAMMNRSLASNCRRGFNPRPRVEGDHQPPVYRSPLARFQSAPSRGGRYGRAIRLRIRHLRFNPRPRVEGDCSPCSPS